MYKTILEFIRRNRLLLPGDRVIVAFSGGADSVCLLVILNELKDVLEISLKAVHVHHGLRGLEADRDSEYAKELTASLSLPFSCAHVDVTGYAKEHRLSVEEAGRHLRYEILEQERILFGGNKIAVAHHKDDQAETILYHLFRGTGLKGLGGIRPERDRIVRPLLSVGKREILAYLEEKGISYCEDSTNSHTDYARNRIRGILLPAIKEQINARAADNIIHAGEMAAKADEYLEKQAQVLLKEWGCFKRDENDALVSSGIKIKGLISQEDILVTYVIRAMIRMVLGSMKDISMIHVESAKALLDSPAGKQVDLPGMVTALRSSDCLWIKSQHKKEAVDNPLDNILPKVDFNVFPYKKGQEIPQNGYTKWFDYDKIKCALSVRYRQIGDYLTLTGGGRKTVKAFMIDEKIPKEDRGKIPLIVDGSHVLWVIGYRISEYYKITEDTHTVIEMQLDGGKNNG
ncbi:tRNA lysidine(34) synthetase TilS [Lacrimispora algidixylanolytica]|uniref:tRNA(Ile)-lysidine synthase n=1 Tax=Lacrimispora algidixylanolytica TaxID=94868 RepID=A0A419TCB8_9FIRM|nr:tRNA lysidine(34) synthetase TilS [Lacrimispora algidixylanolytica]RKD35154.1 tRNA lysidine(34) synthetase TilS [Lacrimispora algidixylanolytica]